MYTLPCAESYVCICCHLCYLKHRVVPLLCRRSAVAPLIGKVSFRIALLPWCTVRFCPGVALPSLLPRLYLPTQHGHCSFVIVDLGLSCVNSQVISRKGGVISDMPAALRAGASTYQRPTFFVLVLSGWGGHSMFVYPFLGCCMPIHRLSAVALLAAAKRPLHLHCFASLRMRSCIGWTLNIPVLHLALAV